MKKWIVLTTLLLSACTPQVTVTSEVTVTSTPLPTEIPIPTPTLHPEFVELQKQIAASGGRFALTADGIVQDRGTPIQGLSVSTDGTMTLIVNGTKITLDPEKATFDEENGFQLEGYGQNEEGYWTEQSPAEMQLNVDIAKWGVDLSDFNVNIGEDGSATLVDKKTGKEVYRNGSWEPLFLGEMIRVKKMCKVTPWAIAKVGPGIPGDLKSYKDKYSQPLVDAYLLFVENRIIPTSGSKGRSFYIGDNCWSMAFFYDENQAQVWYFWKDAFGRVTYEKVFFEVTSNY